MPTPVSWIDPEEFSGLLEKVRGSSCANHPTKDAELSAEDGLFLETGDSESEVDCKIHGQQAESEQTETASQTAFDDFRNRLREIREQAMATGCLERESLPIVEEEKNKESLEASSIPSAHDTPHASPILKEADDARCQGDKQVQFSASLTMDEGSSEDAAMAGKTFSERLQMFVHWVARGLPRVDLFIMGDFGELLVGKDHPKQNWVISSLLAWSATSRMSAVFAYQQSPLLRLKNSEGVLLTAFPCPTRLGLFYVALLSEGDLSEEVIPELRRSLIHAIESDHGSRIETQ